MNDCEMCRDVVFLNVEATRYAEECEPYLTASTFVEVAQFCPRCGRVLPVIEVKRGEPDGD